MLVWQGSYVNQKLITALIKVPALFFERPGIFQLWIYLMDSEGQQNSNARHIKDTWQEQEPKGCKLSRLADGLRTLLLSYGFWTFYWWRPRDNSLLLSIPETDRSPDSPRKAKMKGKSQVCPFCQTVRQNYSLPEASHAPLFSHFRKAKPSLS